MPTPRPQPTLKIEIDASLAVAYRDAYGRVFGAADDAEKSLEEFIAGFVEDRLAEETSFVKEEASEAAR
jgi:hypothetical protein